MVTMMLYPSGLTSVYNGGTVSASSELDISSWETEAGMAMTREILSDPGALAEIRAARSEIARGDVVRGVEAIRALRPRIQ